MLPPPITLPSYSSPIIPCPFTVLELRPTIPHHPHSPSFTASTPCSFPQSPCPHTHLPLPHAQSPCLSFGPLSPITLIHHHPQHQPQTPCSFPLSPCPQGCGGCGNGSAGCGGCGCKGAVIHGIVLSHFPRHPHSPSSTA